MQATVSKKSTKETKPKTKKNVSSCILSTDFIYSYKLI